MKSHSDIKRLVLEQSLLGEAIYPLLEHVLMKVYSMGYVDACDMYRAAIENRGLKEQWNKIDKVTPNG